MGIDALLHQSLAKSNRPFALSPSTTGTAAVWLPQVSSPEFIQKRAVGAPHWNASAPVEMRSFFKTRNAAKAQAAAVGESAAEKSVCFECVRKLLEWDGAIPPRDKPAHAGQGLGKAPANTSIDPSQPK